MAGTRARSLSEEAASKEVDGALATRFEALEKAIASQIEQNERCDGEVREMIEAFKVMANHNPVNASTSGEENHGEVHGAGTMRNESYRYNHHDEAQNYNCRTRLTKIDFPKFDGSNIKEWFTKADEFFAIDNTPNEAKVGIASMHFEGEASTWHQAVRQEDEEAVVLRNWRVYTSRLKERFEEILDDPMAELK